MARLHTGESERRVDLLVTLLDAGQVLTLPAVMEVLGVARRTANRWRARALEAHRGRPLSASAKRLATSASLASLHARVGRKGKRHA